MFELGDFFQKEKSVLPQTQSSHTPETSILAYWQDIIIIFLCDTDRNVGKKKFI